MIGKTQTSDAKFAYNLTHLLVLMSQTRIEGFKLIKGNIINFDLIDFCKEVFARIKTEEPEREIRLVLDNAKLHRTTYFLNFMQSENIKLLFTVSNRPMFNPVEYLFRYLKSSLKSKFTLRQYSKQRRRVAEVTRTPTNSYFDIASKFCGTSCSRVYNNFRE